MSSNIKPSELKKPKTSTYQNSTNLNYSSKNSKLSFTSTSKNNQNKNKNPQINSAKKRYPKNQNFEHHEDKKSENQKLKKEKENDEEEMKENKNYNDKINNNTNEEETQSKRVLKNVDSFQSLGFLLPNKSENIVKSGEKVIKSTKNKKRNRRYTNQDAYDYDGNIIYNNPNFGFDSTYKKRIVDKDSDDDIKNIDLNEDDDSSKEEYLDKLKKQEALIKELLKYKNFQAFIKKILKHRKFGANKEGKKIKWSTFKKYIYNIAFLDLYYRHRIPFIIMRPRLDVIRRKREERERQMKERQIVEEEVKHSGGTHQKIGDIKEGETMYASILDRSIQTEMEKNGYIIGEDNNTVRIEKRESLFPTKDGKPRGIFTLTKIPQKSDDDENSGNIRLKMAFNKAKDAARVVRRLEYSYSMRVNILLSKPIFQKNAKIIQNWYRSMRFIKINTPKIVKIQAFVRGMMIRKAFKEVRDLYERILPFIKEIDKILSKRFAKIFFNKLIPRFGIHTLIKLAQIRNNKIINALSQFHKKQKTLKDNYSLSTKIKKRCCFTKEIFEYKTKLKILKLQANIKCYLMHHNEKILHNYANEYNPKLYYYLKYGKNPELLKKKLKKLRECALKFKELKLKQKYKVLNMDINNKYDYLEYILRKKIFNKLKDYYKESINNKNSDYQKKMKLKLILNRQRINGRKRLLKKYLNIWNIKANYLPEYKKILKEDKMKLIEAIIRYYKKYQEKAFMLQLNTIKEKEIEKEKEKEEFKKDTINKMLKFYNLHNKNHNKEYINNILLKVFKTWKKKAKIISLTKASNTINKNVKLYLEKKRAKQKNKLINCLNIRNKVFKEKLRLWKFNVGKLKHHYNTFINKTISIIKMRKKLESLKKNLSSLEKRKKNYLRKYFERFQTNTGVKKLLCINLQLCLYDENKKIIVNDKYSMMKYIKDQSNINKDEIKNKMTLKAIFKFWKSKQRNNEFKNKCGQRIKAKCELVNSILKLKFIRWYKINRIEKMDKACRLIQKKFRNYKDKKIKLNL